MKQIYLRAIVTVLLIIATGVVGGVISQAYGQEANSETITGFTSTSLPKGTFCTFTAGGFSDGNLVIAKNQTIKVTSSKRWIKQIKLTTTWNTHKLKDDDGDFLVGITAGDGEISAESTDEELIWNADSSEGSDPGATTVTLKNINTNNTGNFTISAIEVTYVERIPAPIRWDINTDEVPNSTYIVLPKSVVVDGDDSFDEPALIDATGEDLTITYKSSGSAVKINSDGEITAIGTTEGTYTLTATSRETPTYLATTASYNIKIMKPTFTADFYKGDEIVTGQTLTLTTCDLDDDDDFEELELRITSNGSDYVPAVSLEQDDAYTVTYTSSTAETIATVDENDGEVDFSSKSKTGTTTITAKISPVVSGQFTAISKTYKISLAKGTPNAQYTPSHHTVLPNDEYFEAPELTVTSGLQEKDIKDDDGVTISYASNKTASATVDSSSGEIAIGSTPGTAVITATIASSTFYNGTSAKDTIVVKQPDYTAGFYMDDEDGQPQQVTAITLQGHDLANGQVELPEFEIAFQLTTTGDDGEEVDVFCPSITESDIEYVTAYTATANNGLLEVDEDDGSITFNDPADITKLGPVTITATTTSEKNHIITTSNKNKSAYTITVQPSAIEAEFDTEAFTVLPAADDLTMPTLTVTCGDDDLQFDDDNVTYTSSNTSVARFTDGELVIGTTEGTATITATVNLGKLYQTTTATFTITVRKPELTATFLDEDDAEVTEPIELRGNEVNTFRAPTLTYQFTTTDEDGADLFDAGTLDDSPEITFTSSNPNIAEVDDYGDISFDDKTQYGLVTITATLRSTLETKQYPDKQVSYTISVQQGSLSAAFDETAFTVLPTADFEAPELTVEANPEEVDVETVYTFTSSDADIAEVDETDGTVTIGEKTGTAIISVTVGADGGRYTEATAQYTITVSKGMLDVAFDDAAATISGNEEVTLPYLNITYDGSTVYLDDDPVYTSSDPAIAEVDESDGTISILAPGTVVITATVPESTQYQEATAQFAITINKGVLTAEFDETAFIVEPEASFSEPRLTDSATPEGVNYDAEYAWSSSDEEIAAVDDDGYVTIGTKEGTATITVTVSAGPLYQEATAQYTITVKATPETQLATISAVGYATFCSNYALDFSGSDDVKAYVATMDQQTMTIVLSRVEEIPAGTGVLLKGSKGEYEIPVITDYEPSEPTENLFVAVTEPTLVSASTDGSHNYVLANGQGGLGFYNLASDVTISAGKCYLHTTEPLVSEGSGSSRVSMRFDDGQVTAIMAAETSQPAVTIYDLQGRPVETPRKGTLYIVNGKKVLMK